jgi:hypothetical protein
MNPLSWTYVRPSHLAMRQHRPERLKGSGNNEGVHGPNHEPLELAVYGASKFVTLVSWCFVRAERTVDFLSTMKVFITVFMNPFVHRGRHGHPTIRRLRMEWQTLGTAPASNAAYHRLAACKPMVEHWEIQNLAELVDALLLPSGRLVRAPTASHEGAVIQMGKRSSLSVEEMADVRRGLCRTRTCELEMIKRLQSQSRTASAHDVAGALTPETRRCRSWLSE